MKKKNLVFLTFLSLSSFVYGQTWIPGTNLIYTNGKVGIGINPPTEQLHIEQSINGELNLLIKNAYTNGARTFLTAGIGKSSVQTDMDFTIQTNGGGWSDKFIVKNNGTIIMPYNITFPNIRGSMQHLGNTSGFTFYSQGSNNSTLGSGSFTFFTTNTNSSGNADAPYRKSFQIGYDGTANVFFNDSYPNIRGVMKHEGNASGFTFYSQGSNNSSLGSGGYTFFTTNSNSTGNTDASYRKSFEISPSGNVAVFGKLEATEVKVTTTPSTADFVFEKNYKLTPISELKDFINLNKHLPEVQSAKDMNDNGINMGEFQIKLLQKVEELTLYTIQQNDKIKELEMKIKELELKNKNINP